MAKKKPDRAKPMVTDDAFTPVYVTQYEITDEPIQERSYRRLPDSIKERLDDLYHEAQRQPRQAIPELIELQKKYPNVPQIYNYLAVAYSHAGEKEKAANNARKHTQESELFVCTHKPSTVLVSKERIR